MLKLIKIILVIPALLVHKLSHIMAILFLGVNIIDINVQTHIGDLCITVNYDSNIKWKKNIISLAPIGGFIIWSFIICLTSGYLFLTLLLYSLIYIRVFFPNKHDIEIYNSNSNLNYTNVKFNIKELKI